MERKLKAGILAMLSTVALLEIGTCYTIQDAAEGLEALTAKQWTVFTDCPRDGDDDSPPEIN